MVIRIETHARGMAISSPEGADRHPQLVQLGQSLGDRAYVSNGRLVAPLETAADVLDVVGVKSVLWDDAILEAARTQSAHRTMQLRSRLEVATALESPLEAIADYPRTSLLDQHQIEALAALTTPSLRGVALFDEQGTGKTICALAAFDLLRLRGHVARMIVTAPKSVLASWQEQTTKFLGDGVRVSLVAGTASNRKRAILRPHDVLLIGYESAVQEETLLKTVLGANPSSYLLVVDESYFVKNPDTARAGSVARLRAVCERAIVLCGTPAPNTPGDVVNQIDIADQGVAFAGRTISKDLRLAALQVKDGLTNAVVLRRLKVDVLPDLAAKETVKTYLDLAPIQKALYDTARQELVSSVRNVDDCQFRRNIVSFLARRVRLLQICSNPRAFDPLYGELPAKLKALDLMLRELIDAQGLKVVVWSHFRASLDSIAERYGHYGVVRIDGSVTSLESRIDAIDRFQNDSTIRVFLGNAAAAGAGITLTAARHAIYESFSNQAAHYMQSVDRIHRRGQKGTVVSHVLIARHTIEDAEYDRLVEKERLGRQLLGDEYTEPMTRERFLADLEQ